MREVKLRFDRKGISIPFPQRDVHLYREDRLTDAAEIGSGGSAKTMEASSTRLSAGDDPEA